MHVSILPIRTSKAWTVVSLYASSILSLIHLPVRTQHCI